MGYHHFVFALAALVALKRIPLPHLHVPYSIFVVSGIVSLIVSGAMVAIGRENLANDGAIVAYCLLVMGVMLAILEHRKQPVSLSDRHN